MERGGVEPNTPILQHSSIFSEVNHAGDDESGADLRV